MKILLIPSAILIPREMRNNFGDIPQVLFPLNNQTMLEHICEEFNELVDAVYVIAHKKAALIDDFVKWKNLHINVLHVPTLGTLGDSIFYGLQQILTREKNVSQVIINFADTLVQDEENNFNISSNYLYFDETVINEEWTYFQEESGKITHIQDKMYKDTYEATANVFVGIFSLTDVVLYSHLLDVHLKNKDTHTDPFYTALKEYSLTHNFSFRKAKQWFDVGHSENFYKAKTGVKAREFNLVEIDEKRGILRKISRSTEKFIGEIQWYIKMPKKLQYLLPRVYDYSLEYSNPYIKMEYYGYNTLHELLIYGNTPLIKWQEIFERLLVAIDDMQKYKVYDSAEIIPAIRDMYITKTCDRINKLKQDQRFNSFFYNDIFINGRRFPSLEHLTKEIEFIVSNMLCQVDYFSIIHGDLCFSNILVEENCHFVRVIDPRGKFGNFDIYGDPRYEIAKIMHSLEGKYDYIIEDMFEVNVHETYIEYSIQEKTEKILQVFEEVFSKLQYDINEIRLIESLLFLSMLPLHKDYPNRQYVMLATGLELFDKVLKNRKEIISDEL